MTQKLSSVSVVMLTDLSLSRERPPRARVPDAWNLAKHEGLQARAKPRPLDGCSEKLAGVFSYEAVHEFASSEISEHPATSRRELPL